MNRIAIEYTYNLVIIKTAPKVNYFCGFCNYRLVITSAHMHAYHYPLLESGMKTGLSTIALCRKDIVLLHEHKEQQQSRLFLNNNWHTAGYGKSIIGIYGTAQR